jgi:hypothetical protein
LPTCETRISETLGRTPKLRASPATLLTVCIAEKRLAVLNGGRRKRVTDDELDHAFAVMQQ